MAAPKGHPKWGGRKKDTPNKNTQALIDRARELGVEPFEILLLFAKGDWKALGYKKGREKRYSPSGKAYWVDVIEVPQRVKAASEAAQYIHAKRKAVELSGPDGEPVKAAVAIDLTGLSDDELKAIRRVIGAKGQTSDKP